MNDRQVRAMFEEIAFSYDLQNSVLSLRRDVAWRKSLARSLSPTPGTVLLDVAVGTAEVAIELARHHRDCRVAGVDFSPAMLEVGRRKILGRGLEGRVTLVRGDARELPVASKSVDAVTIAFGIRNIREREPVLAEFLRVLRPGGQLRIMEFSLPSAPLLGRLYNFYFDRILPPVGNWLSRTDYAYTYLVESVNAFPGPGAFQAEIAAAGFETPWRRRLTFGIASIYGASKPQAAPPSS